MRTSMAYPMRFWAILLACLLIYQFSTETWGGTQSASHETVADVKTAIEDDCKPMTAPADPMRLVGGNKATLKPHGG